MAILQIMPRVSTDHLAARRQQILDRARGCFARHGYEGATVRRLEQATGLSRGAIFHHFGDKEALFFAVAEQDAARMADVVAEHGLVQVMRELLDTRHDDDHAWRSTYLEIARKGRTDPAFRERWRGHALALSAATRARLQRQATTGTLRDDVAATVLARYLELVLEGLVAHLAIPTLNGADGNGADGELTAVLDLVERSVRGPTAPQR